MGAKGKEVANLKDKNVDGAVRDEDTFVLGDDDDENDEQESANEDQVPVSAEPVAVANDSQESQPATQGLAGHPETHSTTAPPRRAQYHIKSGDTLQGIIFKFGVNVRGLRFPIVEKDALIRFFHREKNYAD